MDEWKRTFSNLDKEKVALPWFWEHFDSDCYSLWICEYNYANELKKVFMTSNLINGTLSLYIPLNLYSSTSLYCTEFFSFITRSILLVVVKSIHVVVVFENNVHFFTV